MTVRRLSLRLSGGNYSKHAVVIPGFMRGIHPSAHVGAS